MQIAQTNGVWVKTTSTEDTPSGLAQPCEHQPLLHRLTNNSKEHIQQAKKSKMKQRGQTNTRYKLQKIKSDKNQTNF